MPDYGLADAGSGRGLLPWDWAAERLSSAHNYWLATAAQDGRPHLMPVWGVWLDETFYFSTGPTTVNGRNLAANPALVVHLESGEDTVILEGVAEQVTEPSLVGRINDLYGPKYDWAQQIPAFYALRPHIAMAWLCRGGGPTSESDFKGTATRWRFRDD